MTRSLAFFVRFWKITEGPFVSRARKAVRFTGLYRYHIFEQQKVARESLAQLKKQ
jgi:hypothetical protein